MLYLSTFIDIVDEFDSLFKVHSLLLAKYGLVDAVLGVLIAAEANCNCNIPTTSLHYSI